MAAGEKRNAFKLRHKVKSHMNKPRYSEDVPRPVRVTRHDRDCAAFRQQECDCQESA